MDFYRLDTIISGGYRSNSVRATQILRECVIKGYVLVKKRRENGAFLGDDSFERLLEEMRETRLSERKFYQKITDSYATSMDYNKDAPTTRAFFATVRNKLRFTIHRHTAAELIVERADSGRVSMEMAKFHAENEFEKYRIVQARLLESDFGKSVKALPEGKKGKGKQ